MSNQNLQFLIQYGLTQIKPQYYAGFGCFLFANHPETHSTLMLNTKMNLPEIIRHIREHEERFRRTK